MKKHVRLFCAMGVGVLVISLRYLNRPLDDQGSSVAKVDVRLPWNEFLIPQGYAFYVGLPDYEGRTQERHRTLPTLVDVDLFASVVQKEFPKPLHLRVVMKAEEDDRRETAALRVEPVGFQNIGNFSTGVKRYSLKEGEELTLRAGEDVEWNLDGSEGMKWKILTMGAVGGRAVDALVILAPSLSESLCEGSTSSTKRR